MNPIELIWAGLKKHVREHNTSFVNRTNVLVRFDYQSNKVLCYLTSRFCSLQRLSDIETLSREFIDTFDADAYRKCIEHVRKVEENFGVADTLVEEVIESDLVDSDSDDHGDTDEDQDQDEGQVDDLEAMEYI